MATPDYATRLQTYRSTPTSDAALHAAQTLARSAEAVVWAVGAAREPIHPADRRQYRTQATAALADVREAARRVETALAAEDR